MRRSRLLLVDLVVLVMVVAVMLLLAVAVAPWIEEPDPRTWPRIAWPDGGSR